MQFRVGDLSFEWDDAKADGNLEKRAVAFEDAATVFMDPLAKTYYHEGHSDEEDRYFAIGFARSGRLLSVWYTDRGEAFRLIGARRATPQERLRYNVDSKKG